MRIRTLQTSSVLCAAVAVSFLGWAYVIGFSPEPGLEERQSRAWSPADMEAVVPELAVEIPATLQAAFDRPLFQKQRRPFQPAVQMVDVIEAEAVPEPSPPDTSGLSLKGIVVTTHRRLALIATAQSPEGAWLSDGAEIDGWTVTGLEPDTVTLQSGAQVSKLKLYVDNPAIAVGSEGANP